MMSDMVQVVCFNEMGVINESIQYQAVPLQWETGGRVSQSAVKPMPGKLHGFVVALLGRAGVRWLPLQSRLGTAPSRCVPRPCWVSLKGSLGTVASALGAQPLWRPGSLHRLGIPPCCRNPSVLRHQP